MRVLKVLVGCEHSGLVRDAFTRAGHRVVSNDLLPTDRPGQHFLTDVRRLLTLPWDLGIFFPPCTHLCSSGAAWFAGKRELQEQALELVRMLLDCPIPRVALENPVGIISTRLRKPDQIIQPWQFGHGETKATCLWLKNLPKLTPTLVVTGRAHRVHNMSPSTDRSIKRSLTYLGIAQAMADRVGELAIIT